MSTRQQLVKELVSCRSFLLSQLADLAEEQGRHYEARAWRWLRDHEKYPGKRHYGPSHPVPRYGWQLTGDSFWLGEEDDDLTIAEKPGGPTILPKELSEKKLVKTTPYPSREEALIAAAEGMAELIKENEEYKKNSFVRCPECQENVAPVPQKRGRYLCPECGARLKVKLTFTEE